MLLGTECTGSTGGVVMGNGVHTYAPRATSSDAIVMNELRTANKIIGGHAS